jgi:CDP-diacylglycerol---glycerol-3-phosphate 3-phosphatidyltransferase
VRVTLPNKITLLRILASPLFFVVFFLPRWAGYSAIWLTVGVWAVWGVIELSDVADGYAARKLGLVSDIGKLFDPFADVVSRLTFFFCFTLAGLMPPWIFIILLYRELGITFLRIFALSKGKTVGANLAGKIKAVFYTISAAGGLLLYTAEGHGRGRAAFQVTGLYTAVFILFVVTAGISLASFCVYLFRFFHAAGSTDETS